MGFVTEWWWEEMQCWCHSISIVVSSVKTETVHALMQCAYTMRNERRERRDMREET